MTVSVKYAIRNKKNNVLFGYDVSADYSEEEGVLFTYSLCTHGQHEVWTTNNIACALRVKNSKYNRWYISLETPEFSDYYNKDSEVVAIYTLDDSLTIVTNEGVPQTIEELTGGFDKALELSSFEFLDGVYTYSEQQHKYLKAILEKGQSICGEVVEKDSVLDYYRIVQVLESQDKMPVFDPMPLFKAEIEKLTQKYL